jgi:hypothetical protein
MLSRYRAVNMRPNFARSTFFIGPLLVGLALAPLMAAQARPSAGNGPYSPLLTATQSRTPTRTPTATLCPQPTSEPLWVEPVTSPTSLFTQTITVRIGNGDAVTVTAESGTFTVTGNFNAYNNPALITMTLVSNTTHHLNVAAHVRPVSSGGCQYGNYTLTTTVDRFGNPLTIEQVFAAQSEAFLPLVLRSGASADDDCNPTATPTLTPLSPLSSQHRITTTCPTPTIAATPFPTATPSCAPTATPTSLQPLSAPRLTDPLPTCTPAPTQPTPTPGPTVTGTPPTATQTPVSP